MAKKSGTQETEIVSDISNDKLSLDEVGYAIVQTKTGYNVVKFNFDSKSKKMSELEVLVQCESQWDAADEMIIQLETELYQ